jgi:hypothetical protein
MSATTSARTTRDVGERVELGRYRTVHGERILIGQGVCGVVRVSDVPASDRGRRYLVRASSPPRPSSTPSSRTTWPRRGSTPTVPCACPRSRHRERVELLGGGPKARRIFAPSSHRCARSLSRRLCATASVPCERPQRRGGRPHSAEGETSSMAPVTAAWQDWSPRSRSPAGAIWHMLCTDGTYRDLGPDSFTNRDPNAKRNASSKGWNASDTTSRSPRRPQQPERTFPARHHGMDS